MMITLSKHHGLDNDFLVCDAAQFEQPMSWPETARRWCDRRVGVGADGLLLLAIAGQDELSMVLYNADGSRAEMSGNGIRCLAQAAYLSQGRSGVADYRVHTDAGTRTVRVVPIDTGTIEAEVVMGEVTAIIEPDGWRSVGADPLRPVLHLSTGNPHTVVAVDDILAVDLEALGAKIPDVNLEIIEAGPEAHAITMRVHERGAGITAACGTGACASAWAATHWGLARPSNGEILVHMDGGDARVRIDEPEPGQVTLVGPSVFIAHLQIDTQ